MQVKHVENRTVVIKIGTGVIANGDGSLALERLQMILDQISEFHRHGYRFLVVSSGAVGLGKKYLGMSGKLSLKQKQACAASGQSLLMHTYQSLLSNRQIKCAQVLLTADDLGERKRYLALRDTLEQLLSLGVIPIINENDAVSTQELETFGKEKNFGDNDKLSALVAAKIDADILILLTDVDGLYDKNPKNHPDAKIIKIVEKHEDLKTFSTDGKSDLGRGGMMTKVEAMRIATVSGSHCVIASGFIDQTIKNILTCEDLTDIKRPGTLGIPAASMNKKKRWIGFSAHNYGNVVVNLGAARALIEKNASLLSVGVIKTEGSFSPGDTVNIVDENGTVLGKGISYFSNNDIDIIKGLSSHRISELLPNSNQDVVIQRDNMVIFKEIKQ